MDTFTNSATLSYTYDGSAGTRTAQSNDVTTTRLNCYGCEIEKIAVPETYRLGEPVTYLVLLTNTGSRPLEALCFVDNLGAEDGCTPPLTYVPGSARLMIGDVVTPLTPAACADGLRFTLPDPLAVDATATVVYSARVACQLPSPCPASPTPPPSAAKAAAAAALTAPPSAPSNMPTCASPSRPTRRPSAPAIR